MRPEHLRALEIVQDYTGTSEPLKRLGFGIGGVVFLSADLRTAIKVLNTTEQYSAEVKSYQILARSRKSNIVGVTIPKMRSFEDNRRIIRMDFVSPPFLLDFAGAHFSHPRFDKEIWDEWHRTIDRFYGENSWIAYRVFNELKEIGIFYLDFRPTNLKLDGFPDLVQQPSPTDDDDL